MTRDDHLTHDGITQPVAEWALDYGITPEVILQRLRQGWTAERAITKPMRAQPGERLPEPKQGPKTLSFQGRTKTIAEWAKTTGLTNADIYYRLNNGWTLEKTLTTPNRKRRGVVCNLPASVGTGGGSSAQEITNIGIFE